VIKGSAVNHSGFTTSLTAPNPSAQTDLLMAAYQNAGVRPWTVSYIETHGTGTELGDPIEVNGLKKAFERLGERFKDHGAGSEHYCGIGSVKTKIGHLESAAGIAGVIKVLLAMQHKTLPASINFQEINPYIDLKGSPFYLVQQTQKWEVIKDSRNEPLPRRAGVSSFGIGGANAHVVLEEYGQSEQKTESSPAAEEAEEVILLSAEREDRLMGYAESLLEFLESTEVGRCDRLRDVAYTLQVGRKPFDHRLAAVVRNKEELFTKLQAFLQHKQMVGLFVGSPARRSPLSQIALGADHARILSNQTIYSLSLSGGAELGSPVDPGHTPILVAKRLAYSVPLKIPVRSGISLRLSQENMCSGCVTIGGRSMSNSQRFKETGMTSLQPRWFLAILIISTVI